MKGLDEDEEDDDGYEAEDAYEDDGNDEDAVCCATKEKIDMKIKTESTTGLHFAEENREGSHTCLQMGVNVC